MGKGTVLVSVVIVVVVGCINLIQARIVWEKGTTVEKIYPEDWPEGKPVGHFLNNG